MDRWIISKLNTLIKDARACYDNYDVTGAGRLIQDFVCDQVSNWYVRLGRKRFWGGSMNADKLSAYQTLYEVLCKVALLASPIAPFYMDLLYTDLVPSCESVHFELMPEYDGNCIDGELEERMDLAQRATSMVLALRRKVNIKVRQPLSKLVIPVISNDVRCRLEAVKNLILGEINVKEAEFISETTGLITKKIKPNFKTLGKAYGKQMKEIAAAFAALTQEQICAIEAAPEGFVLNLPSGDVCLKAGDYEIHSEDMPGWLVATDGPLTLALDITLTDELVREGTARELINRIQNLRKDSGFAVTDRVEVEIYAEGSAFEEISSSTATFADYIAAQTLATKVSLSKEKKGSEIEWTEGSIWIDVTKITL